MEQRITISEAIKATGLSKYTLKIWVDNGLIPAEICTIGTPTRTVKLSDIAHYILNVHKGVQVFKKAGLVYGEPLPEWAKEKNDDTD